MLCYVYFSTIKKKYMRGKNNRSIHLSVPKGGYYWGWSSSFYLGGEVREVVTWVLKDA